MPTDIDVDPLRTDRARIESERKRLERTSVDLTASSTLPTQPQNRLATVMFKHVCDVGMLWSANQTFIAERQLYANLLHISEATWNRAERERTPLTHRIPYRIHWIWLNRNCPGVDDPELPRTHLQTMKSWIRFHPEIHAFLWKDCACQRLLDVVSPPMCKHVFARLTTHTSRTHWMKLVILLCVGGLCVDTNIECRACLFHEFNKSELIALYPYLNCIDTSVLGARPKHPYVWCIMQTILERLCVETGWVVNTWTVPSVYDAYTSGSIAWMAGYRKYRATINNPQPRQRQHDQQCRQQQQHPRQLSQQAQSAQDDRQADWMALTPTPTHELLPNLWIDTRAQQIYTKHDPSQSMTRSTWLELVALGYAAILLICIVLITNRIVRSMR